MTVLTTGSSVEYTGNGATTIWPWVGFRIDSADDLQVVLVEIATDIETVVNPSLYTATGFGLDAGGSVTYPLSGPALAATHRIVIQRVVPYEQNLDILNQGGFLPDIAEAQLDRIVMGMQQLARQVAILGAGSVLGGGSFLPLTGGVMQGDITMSLSKVLKLDGLAGTTRKLAGYTGNVLRWEMELGGSGAESGANAGSDFALKAYADNGAAILTPLIVRRDDGEAEFYGPVQFNGMVDVKAALRFSNDISPAQITATQNDYGPTGYATALRYYLDSDAERTITGLLGGAPGRMLILINDGANNIRLTNDDAGSAAANRIYTPGAASIRITPGCAGILTYDENADGGVGRWRVSSFSLMRAGPAQMEAASGFEYVSPVDMHRHPGVCKAWAKVGVSAGTPSLAASYGVSGITDTGTGQLTVTWSTAFSSANYDVQVSVERASTALTVANLRYAAVRNGGQAAGSVLLECWDGTAATALAVDPASWYVAAHGDQ